MTIQERLESLKKQQIHAQEQIIEWEIIFRKTTGAIELATAILKDEQLEKTKKEK